MQQDFILLLTMKEYLGNPFLKKIAEKISDPILSQNVSIATATILNYDIDYNVADIEYIVNGEKKIKTSVPVLINPSLFLQNGDMAVVAFLFSDPETPLILGKIDNDYINNTKNKLTNVYLIL